MIEGEKTGGKRSEKNRKWMHEITKERSEGVQSTVCSLFVEYIVHCGLPWRPVKAVMELNIQYGFHVQFQSQIVESKMDGHGYKFGNVYFLCSPLTTNLCND